MQCCLGGLSTGFKLVQLNPRVFRFSVANNKVGHFIYGLKDRVWLDFICHFHLFNGRFNHNHLANFSWHADEELLLISARKPMAISSCLCSNDLAGVFDHASLKELSKFELHLIKNMVFSNAHHAEASSSSVEVLHPRPQIDSKFQNIKFLKVSTYLNKY